MKAWLRNIALGAAGAGMGIGLSGCIVAAVPLVMAAGAAGVAATGFVVYKSVQTTGGGTVRIAFGSSDPKHAAPPQALPPFASAAVWATGGRERKFGEVLRQAGKFRVVISETGPLAADPEARAKAYDAVCRQQRVYLVLSAVDLGQTVNSNMLSFKRGAVTQKLTLEGYGCEAHKLVWGDSMAVIIESGRQPTPQAEIDSVAGQAWAERVLQAAATGR